MIAKSKQKTTSGAYIGHNRKTDATQEIKNKGSCSYCGVQNTERKHVLNLIAILIGMNDRKKKRRRKV